MDPIVLAIAFILGFIAKQMSLPPLVGYLFAGFILNALGFEFSQGLEVLAQLGITLLLFTVGLKLSIKNLIKPEVIGVASAHMLVMSLLSTAILSICTWFMIMHFGELSITGSIVLGFALSFSSTVVVFKVLEENNELKTRHGQIAIGILVLQDIAAILFLALTTGKLPHEGAVLLLLLPLIKPLLYMMLNKSGHEEMLVFSGVFLAVVGGYFFESLGVKSDLGALVLGILLSNHKKASELSKSLLHFKDLFLVGFFLSIGFVALPTVEMLVSALLLTGAIVVKFILFFLLLILFKVRGRTAYLASLSLANFSEFGLIVMSYSVDNHLVTSDFLVITAIALTFSFIISSIVNKRSHHIYIRLKDVISALERKEILNEDVFEQPIDARILVVGMGRVGTGAYREACKQEEHVWGIDSDTEKAKRHKLNGLNVIKADAENYDFWQSISHKDIDLIMLAMPTLQGKLEVMEKLKAVGYNGRIAAITKYEDDRQTLLDAGADIAFNVYAEAGIGFADETFRFLKKGTL